MDTGKINQTSRICLINEHLLNRYARINKRFLPAVNLVNNHQRLRHSYIDFSFLTFDMAIFCDFKP